MRREEGCHECPVAELERRARGQGGDDDELVAEFGATSSGSQRGASAAVRSAAGIRVPMGSTAPVVHVYSSTQVVLVGGSVQGCHMSHIELGTPGQRPKLRRPVWLDVGCFTSFPDLRVQGLDGPFRFLPLTHYEYEHSVAPAAMKRNSAQEHRRVDLPNLTNELGSVDVIGAKQTWCSFLGRLRTA